MSRVLSTRCQNRPKLADLAPPKRGDTPPVVEVWKGLHVFSWEQPTRGVQSGVARYPASQQILCVHRLVEADASTWPFFERRLEVLRNVDSPAFPRIVAFHLSQPEPFFVTIRHDATSLTDWLQTLAQVPSQRMLRQLAIGVLEGLASLHMLGFVHGKITTRNVLVRADGSAQIAGLDQLLLVGEESKLCVADRTPEACTSQDIFDAGIVLGELMGSTFANSKLARAMLSSTPENRPTASDLVTLLRSAEDCGLDVYRPAA